MSERQDKLDRGEITLEQFNARWDDQIEENERLHPDIHDRWYARLMELYPGEGVDADVFFGSENRG